MPNGFKYICITHKKGWAGFVLSNFPERHLRALKAERFFYCVVGTSPVPNQPPPVDSGVGRVAWHRLPSVLANGRLFFFFYPLLSLFLLMVADLMNIK